MHVYKMKMAFVVLLHVHSKVKLGLILFGIERSARVIACQL